MHVRLSLACILIFVASVTLAQQESQITGSKLDRDNAGLRGPVETVLEEQTRSYANGPQAVTRTMTYAPDGRTLEERQRNTDGSETVSSYSYYPDGRLLGIVSGNPATSERSLTTCVYDDGRRLIGWKSGDGKESRQFRFLREIWSKLNPEEIHTMAARQMALAAEQRRFGGEGKTITTYNDHGDKASERTTIVRNLQVGSQDQDPPLDDDSMVRNMTLMWVAHRYEQLFEIYEIRYTYQYDQYGNWTEQTTAGRARPDEAFQPRVVVHRKLTYY